MWVLVCTCMHAECVYFTYCIIEHMRITTNISLVYKPLWVCLYICVCSKICFWCQSTFITGRDKQHLTSPKYSRMHTYAITITHSIRILGLQPSHLSKGSLGAVKLSECRDLSSPQRPAPSISHKIYREANTGCDEDAAARRREIKMCVCGKWISHRRIHWC